MNDTDTLVVYSSLKANAARYCYPLPRDPAYSIDDLVQDAALRVLEAPDLDHPRAARSYAYSTLRATARDRAKYRLGAKRGPEVPAATLTREVPRLRSTDATPEDDCYRAELRSITFAAARSLVAKRWSEGLRVRIAELTLEGFSQDEVADHLGVGSSGVQKFLTRLRNRIRQLTQ